MKVSELIDILKTMPQDIPVYFSAPDDSGSKEISEVDHLKDVHDNEWVHVE